METAGWPARLIGGKSDQASTTSLCKTMPDLVYLTPNSMPATGLFLDKLQATRPCGARMPNLPPVLNATQIDCIQKWANSIVSGGTGI